MPPDISKGHKRGLTKRYKLLNPVKLQQEVHDAVDSLVSLNKNRES
jgi:hypothetical protein